MTMTPAQFQGNCAMPAVLSCSFPETAPGLRVEGAA